MVYYCRIGRLDQLYYQSPRCLELGEGDRMANLLVLLLQKNVADGS